MNIYIGNLPYEATDKDLEKLFAEFGKLRSAKVITDAYSGKSKGFGFVEFESPKDGQRAIQELNGVDFSGRAIVVNQARPKKERRGGPRF